MPTFSRYNIRLSQIEDTAKVLSLYRDVAEKPGGLARLPFEITSHYVENFLKATVSRGLGFVAVDNNDDVVAEIHAYSPEIFCFSHVLTDLTIAVHPRFQGDGIGLALLSSSSRLLPRSARILAQWSLSRVNPTNARSRFMRV